MVCLLTVLEQWIMAGEFRQTDSLRVIEWLADEVSNDRSDWLELQRLSVLSGG